MQHEDLRCGTPRPSMPHFADELCTTHSMEELSVLQAIGRLLVTPTCFQPFRVLHDSVSMWWQRPWRAWERTWHQATTELLGCSSASTTSAPQPSVTPSSRGPPCPHQLLHPSSLSHPTQSMEVCHH
jgi:hypothetical protein